MTTKTEEPSSRGSVVSSKPRRPSFLIPNHFHLRLRPTETTLGLFMRRLLTGYAVTFNLRHRRSGHLFQNRYKPIVWGGECGRSYARAFPVRIGRSRGGYAKTDVAPPSTGASLGAALYNPNPHRDR